MQSCKELMNIVTYSNLIFTAIQCYPNLLNTHEAHKIIIIYLSKADGVACSILSKISSIFSTPV